MISVGIDVSKGKSMVCIMKPGGNIVAAPYELLHDKESVNALVERIHAFDEETRVVMEDTGHYHWPLIVSLVEHDVYVSCINSLRMKKFCSQSIRRAKTDKIDSIKIATYGITYWQDLERIKPKDEVYSALRTYSRQYYQYTVLVAQMRVNLENLLDQTMPGIKKLLEDQNGTHKLSDFVYRYWHFEHIRSMSKIRFAKDYCTWAKKQGYRLNELKAEKIYALAESSIPVLPNNDPTKVIVQELVRSLHEIDKSRNTILAYMDALARTLPEYSVVRDMYGVGMKTAPLLIAEIGDIRRFRSKSSLIAYAGIDTPPYQSGRFTATQCSISKRGNKYLRRIGFEVTLSLLRNKPIDDPVYMFIKKKQSEGKTSKLALIAGLNKFLRIYYARVNEVYKELNCILEAA